MPLTNVKPITILMADDDEDDRLLEHIYLNVSPNPPVVDKNSSKPRLGLHLNCIFSFLMWSRRTWHSINRLSNGLSIDP